MSHSESQGPHAVHSSGMEGTACLTLRVKVHLLSILVEWRGTACLTLRVKVHLLYILVEWRVLHVSL